MLYPSRRITNQRTVDREYIARAVTWVILVYVSIVLLLPLTGADQFLNGTGQVSGQSTLARLAIYAAPLGLFSIFLGVLFWDTMRTGGVRVLRIYRRVGYILVPFGLVAALALAFLFHPTASWGEHESGSSLTAFWLPFQFFILFFTVSLTAIPTVVRHYRAIFTLIFIVLVGTLLSEPLFSTDYSSQYLGRAVGFTGQPNVAAQLVVTLSIASVDWRKPRRLDGIILLVAGVAVAFTFSRGGLIMYGFTLVAYLALVAKLRMKTLLQFIVLTVLLTSTLVFWQTEITSFLESNEFFSQPVAYQRVSMLTAMAEGNFSAIEDLAERDRAQGAYEAIDLINQSPILGYGTNFGSTLWLGIHNIYLNQWIDNGFLGLVFLLVYLFASFWHFKMYKDVRGMVFVVAFSLSGIFSHNLLEQTPFSIMFGLLGALAYIEYLGLSVSRSSLPKA